MKSVKPLIDRMRELEAHLVDACDLMDSIDDFSEPERSDLHRLQMKADAIYYQQLQLNSRELRESGKEDEA